MVTDLHLFTLRNAAKGFLISLRASSRYKPRYLEELEGALALLCEYAESEGWPAVSAITTAHLEEYLTFLQDRPRWFGEREAEAPRKVSKSYIETNYRRLKRFWNWLVQRGHARVNPLELIPHPKIDERVVPTLSERELAVLLALTNPRAVNGSVRRFRAIRDRAALYLLIDTPGRRDEIATLKVYDCDLDEGTVKVLGKGGKERIMGLGSTAIEALWEYLQVRASLNPRGDALWIDYQGHAMRPTWLYLMLKRLGKRAGIPGLHTHQFRHTYAVSAIRAGMPEEVLRREAGWRKIPETYLRTLGTDDVIRFHRQISPADRLADRHRELTRGKRVTGKRPRGRL